MTPAEPRKHRILFLAANPDTSTRLALDEECRAIEGLLREAKERDRFELRSEWAATRDDVMRALNEVQPDIVHFAGHGDRAGNDTHILLHGGTTHGEPLDAAALAHIIKVTSPRTRIVVLNACYSDEMGRALVETVECVVGMRGAIEDGAARQFSAGFYRALGFGRSVGNAVGQARARIVQPRSDLIVCQTCDGLSPDDITLDPAAIAERQLRTALEQYSDVSRTERDYYGLLVGQMQSWLEHHQFRSIRLHDNWRKKLRAHRIDTESTLSIVVPARFADDECLLELGLWWGDERPAAYTCFYIVPWRFKLRPQHKDTQLHADKQTSSLTRSLPDDALDATVNSLLDELEDAATIARG